MSATLDISIDAKSVLKELEKINAQMPGISRKLVTAINAEVKKQVKNEARIRGYKAHSMKSWGDAGYQPNLKSAADKHYNAKVFFTKDSFIYNFIEFGADVQPRNAPRLVFQIDGEWKSSTGFSYPARPLLYPIADSIWRTDRAVKIAESRFQKELDKIHKEAR